MNLAGIAQWWARMSSMELAWIAIGFSAQLMFSLRFIVQWLASEKARRSVVPEAFWYFSLTGGLMLTAYALHRTDPVFILGQVAALAIYSRNIYFICRGKRASELAKELEISG
jgi:lipid-A-disaccharide synthase-like uncharacterized protein